MSRGIMSNSRSKARSSQSTWPIVFAASAVSASAVRAMKSGTAKRGSAPGSPVMVIWTAGGCCGWPAGGWRAPGRDNSTATHAAREQLRARVVRRINVWYSNLK